MTERKRVWLLVAILLIVTAVSVTFSLHSIYMTSIDQQLERLRVGVQTRARLVEAFARYLSAEKGLSGEALFSVVMPLVSNAHERFKGFGRTGEVVVGRVSDGSVEVIFERDHEGFDFPDRLPLGSHLGVPIQKAVSGESGVMVGRDYQGRRVLAAFEPIRELDLGVVNKIDLSEVRAPFIRSGLLALGLSAIFILAGVFLFVRVTRPWIDQIRNSEARYRELVGNINSGVAVYEAVEDGRDFVFKDFNMTGERIDELARDEVIGKKVTEAFPGVEEFGLLDVLRRVWRTGTPEAHPETFYRDGRIEGWRKNYVYKLPPGEIVAVYEDVTERRRMREELRVLNRDLEHLVAQRTAELEVVNKELESFAYSVSHDLRAPLRAINGFSQVLLEDHAKGLDGEGRKDLRRIRAAAQRMAELIDDLLKLSQITRSEMKRERVDLSAAAAEIVEELKTGDPGREVEVSIESGLSAWGDRGLLEILLRGLLENAWKFTGGKPRARIEVGALKSERESAFFVRDDGVGFDMAYADKLFGAFQRLHRTDEFPGTGIGLATAHRIVSRHGGRIWGEAEVGSGAKFSFTLPGRGRRKGD